MGFYRPSAGGLGASDTHTATDTFSARQDFEAGIDVSGGGGLRVADGPWFDVTHPDYGAVGDGVTDDTAAIQAAIDALPSYGGVVFFPPGDFIITATLTVNAAKSVTLRGSGQGGAFQGGPTILHWTGGASPIISVITPAETFTIEDLEFENTGTATIGINIPGPSIQTVRIKGVTIFPTTDFSTAQISLGTVGLVLDVTLLNTYLRSPTTTPNSTLLKVERCNLLTGINLRSIYGQSVLGGASQALVSASFHGSSFEGWTSGDALVAQRVFALAIHGCYFENDGSGYAINAGATVARGVSVRGSYFSGTAHGSSTSGACRMSDASGVFTMEDCYFASYANPSYAVVNVAARRIVVKGCHFASTGLVETDVTTPLVAIGNVTASAARDDRLPGGVAIGTNPALSGQVRLPHAKGIYWRDSTNGNDRSLVGFGEIVADEFYLGNPNEFTHLRSNLAAASSPSNGDWWAEVVNDVPAVKIRTGGATRDLATKKTLGPFVQDDAAATQSAVALNLYGDTTRSSRLAVRAGSITGIVVRSNEARTAGTLTVDVTINGTVTGLTAVLDGTNATVKATTQATGLDAYVAGDQIGVKITTDAGWLPVTADIAVEVEVVE